MKKTTKIIIGAAVVIILIIGFGWYFSKSQQIVKNNSEPIKIGWIGPLTGGSAILGMDSSEVAKITINDLNTKGGINGRKLELMIEDDQYSTEKSISSYEKLVSSGVRIILIQTYGGVFALAERAKTDGVVLIDCLDSNDNLANLGKNIFSVGVESESIAKLLANYSNKENYEKIGILYFNSDTFMPYVKDKLLESFKGQSVSEGYAAGARDFRTSLTKMKAANIKALVCLGYDECGIAVYQARTMELNVPLLMPGTITSPSLQEVSKGTVGGAIFTYWLAPKDTEPAKSFVKEFKAIKGREPYVDLFTYPTYDAIKSIEIALENSKSNQIDDFIAAMRNIRGVAGVTGEINFAKDNSMRIPFKLFKLVNGKPVILE
jgi:branched-chain amino acid transport system substrate-binding protein